jgi:hypothetical protein
MSRIFVIGDGDTDPDEFVDALLEGYEFPEEPAPESVTPARDTETQEESE